MRLPLEQVETYLSDVERWPAFLAGLSSAERSGHERYIFCLRDGRDCRDVVVAVRHRHATHAFDWKALEGPTFRGCLQLTRIDEGHTSIRLELWAHPGTFTGGLVEMVAPRMDRAAWDLRALEDQLVAVP